MDGHNHGFQNGRGLDVATRNDERSDAQSRADFDAQSVRTSVTMGAGYLGSWPLSMIR
jgi:hypothetical protein